MGGIRQGQRTPLLVTCIALLPADVAKNWHWLRPGHRILIEVYHVLETGDQYQDAGAADVTERWLQNMGTDDTIAEEIRIGHLTGCGATARSRLERGCR